MVPGEGAPGVRLEELPEANGAVGIREPDRDQQSPGTMSGGVWRQTGVVGCQPVRHIHGQADVVTVRVRKAFDHVHEMLRLHAARSVQDAPHPASLGIPRKIARMSVAEGKNCDSGGMGTAQILLRPKTAASGRRGNAQSSDSS
jgi:hypothetical protein